MPSSESGVNAKQLALKESDIHNSGAVTSSKALGAGQQAAEEEPLDVEIHDDSK